MNPANLDYISDDLKALKLMLNDRHHGGLHLNGEDLTAFIEKIDDMAQKATRLENAYSQAEWNRRARVDHFALVKGNSAAILDAMRSPDSNVRLFPIAPRPVIHFGDGGDAA